MAKALLHLMCFMLRDESCDVRFEKQAAYAFYSTASNPKDLANYIRHAVVQAYGAQNYTQETHDKGHEDVLGRICD